MWSDIFGKDVERPITRAEAMTIPAVVRARGLITTTMARLPLRALRGGEEIDTPRWIVRSDGELSPFHRMLWTADDLLFYGWSLWQCRRAAGGEIIEATRIAPSRWEIDENGAVRVDDRPVSASEVILFPGIHEGLLAFGGSTLREAADLNAAAARTARTPNAMLELHQTSEAKLSDDEAAELISRWVKARRSKNGGVAFTNAGVEVKEHGAAAEHLLIEGRNTAAVDIARLCGIPAPMIDAAISGSSLSYSNPNSRMAELVTFGVAPFLSAVSARLSQDDVIARGCGMEFVTTEVLAPITNVSSPDDLRPRPDTAVPPDAMPKDKEITR